MFPCTTHSKQEQLKVARYTYYRFRLSFSNISLKSILEWLTSRTHSVRVEMVLAQTDKIYRYALLCVKLCVRKYGENMNEKFGLSRTQWTIEGAVQSHCHRINTYIPQIHVRWLSLLIILIRASSSRIGHLINDESSTGISQNQASTSNP